MESEPTIIALGANSVVNSR